MESNIQQNEEVLPISVEEMKVNKIVIVVGSTGSGKSTIMNMLFNNDYTKEACEEPCEVGFTANSVTKAPLWYFSHHNGKVYGDTVGLGDPNRSDLEIAMGLKEFMKINNLGVHCIIIVAKFGRFSQEERCNLQIISEIFDSRWATNCIMVLTHYAGKTDDKSQKDAIQKWLGEDKEMKEFVSKFSDLNQFSNLILTNNSILTEEYEKISRPLRKQCLEKLNTFVDKCDILVGPAPKGFIEVIAIILERLFGFYRIKHAVTRIKNIVTYLKSNNVKTGTCSICIEVMEMSNMAQASCLHIFHKKCISEWVRTSPTCPLCRQDIHTIRVVSTSFLQKPE